MIFGEDEILSNHVLYLEAQGTSPVRFPAVISLRSEWDFNLRLPNMSDETGRRPQTLITPKGDDYDLPETIATTNIVQA